MVLACENKFNWRGLVQLLHENVHEDYFLLRVESEMAKDIQSINRELPVSHQGRNKLGSYRNFKQNWENEYHIRAIKSKQERSALAKVRCGVVPVLLEIWCYVS